MLEVDAIDTFYGESQALFGVTLAVGAGEAVALLGRNGMGKTTTVRSIMGIRPPRSGRVRIDGADVAGWPSHRIARLGLGLVPEGRQIFPNLSVRENLLVAARDGNAAGAGRRFGLAEVLGLFPQLAGRTEQAGNRLSGGEQQMLAIGRALMTNPRLLVLDEATEGLAPLVRAEIWAALARLKAGGLAILVIDKDVQALAALADRMAVLEKGRVVWSGGPQALLADVDLLHRRLGV